MTPKIIRSTEGLALMGDRQNIKLRSEDTDGKIAIIYSIVPAGSGIPIHMHSREDEIFEITDGELELTINGEVQLLGKGDVVFLPKNESHGFRAVKDTQMWVTLIPGGGEKMFEEMAALPPGPPDMIKVAAIANSYGIKFV